MSYVQNYPLLPPLPKIERHDQLPDDAVVIGQLREGYKQDDPLYMFIKRGNYLSIVLTYDDHWGGQDHYTCEMLAVGSTTRGYALKNRSRDSKGVDADPDYYEPTSLSLDYELLNDFGLLRFWKDLGDKYEKGLL